jgi:hypothetical protein
MWIPFNLHYTYLFHARSKQIDDSPLFEHGNYCGKNERHDDTPMDFMWLKSFDDKYHQVDDIQEFSITKPNHNAFLDKHHIAHLLFIFKEDRLVNFQGVDFINNVIRAWRDDGGHLIDPQCAPR